MAERKSLGAGKNGDPNADPNAQGEQQQGDPNLPTEEAVMEERVQSSTHEGGPDDQPGAGEPVPEAVDFGQEDTDAEGEDYIPYGMRDDDEIVQANVVKSMRFTHDDGRQEMFHPGRHTVTKRVADHWFFAAHTDNPPKPDLVPGTPEYMADQLQQKRQKELAQAANAQRMADQALEDAKSREQSVRRDRRRRRLGQGRLEEEPPNNERELQERVMRTAVAEQHHTLNAAANRAAMAYESVHDLPNRADNSLVEQQQELQNNPRQTADPRRETLARRRATESDTAESEVRG